MAKSKLKKSTPAHSSWASTTKRLPRRQSAGSTSSGSPRRSAKAGGGPKGSRSRQTDGKAPGSVKEDEIESYFVEQVDLYGGKAWKFATPGRRGPPDRLVAFPFNRIFLVELKRPIGGRLSAQQRAFQLEAALVGVDVVYLSTKEAVDKWVKEVA